jgi:hypothetical protein
VFKRVGEGKGGCAMNCSVGKTYVVTTVVVTPVVVTGLAHTEMASMKTELSVPSVFVLRNLRTFVACATKTIVCCVKMPNTLIDDAPGKNTLLRRTPRRSVVPVCLFLFVCFLVSC